MRLAMLMGVLLAGVCSAAGAKDGKPVTFTTTARVEVDADGKLVKVEAAQDLPEPVRAYVERQIAQWTFAPNVREGVTGNAVTWVTLGACALPQENGTYAMGIAYGGNGPRIAGGTWPHPEGIGAWALRTGFTGMADLQFTVNADGTAKLDDIEGVPSPGHRKKLQALLAPWVAGQRFDPEQIAGKPVATRSRLGIDFVVDSGRSPHDAARATERSIDAKALASPACQRAGMAVVPGMHSIAVDSVVSVEPAI